MTDVFTPKQQEEIRALKHNEFKRLNIYDGSVRSGKTWISCVIWCLWVASRKGENNFLMCAKNLTALKRNVLEVCIDIFGSDNISYSLTQKVATIFGKTVYLEGANDARSESKIRGMTLKGAYCDELTLFPEDFFKMLLTRLSVSKAKLFATTNPDSPNHWLYTGYLLNDGVDLRRTTFLLDDNTTLDPDYARNLKKEFQGVFYDRYILSRWVIAEGVIYDMFGDHHIVPSEPRNYTQYYVSCDYGTQNPTVFGLWGYYQGVWYKVKEYHHSGRDERAQKTDREYADDYQAFTKGMHVKALIVDPSAASFIAELKQRGIPVIPAKNEVIDGIRLTASLLKNNAIKICDCCKETIKEFYIYSWDAKSIEDKPIKDNDHHMDETRYFCNTILNKANKWRSSTPRR